MGAIVSYLVHKPPQETLLSIIKKRQWDTVVSMVQCNSSYLETTDERGCNILHMCLCDRCSSAKFVTKRLIELSSQKVLMMQNTNGATPLHLACFGLVADGISILIAKKCPAAAAITDKRGWTPLAYALIFLENTNTIRMLLEIYPAAVSKRFTKSSRRGITPMHNFFATWNMHIRGSLGVIEETKDMDSLLDLPICFRSSVPFKKLKVVYNTALLILKAATADTTSSSPSTCAFATKESPTFQPLHAALKVRSCPYSFLRLLLKFHPDEIHDPDPDGNFLLHNAVAAEPSSDGDLYQCEMCEESLDCVVWHQNHADGLLKFCGDCEKRRTKTNCFLDACFSQTAFDKKTLAIKSLLMIQKHLACVPDATHRLPLHHVTSNDQHYKTYSDGCIQLLVNEAPQALTTRDLCNHLYPFMAAAAQWKFVETWEEDKTKKYRYSVEGDEKSELNQFQTCFELLMKVPNLVLIGTLKREDKKKRKRGGEEDGGEGEKEEKKKSKTEEND